MFSAILFGMSITQNELREAIKDAMRAKQEVRLSVLRGLLSSSTNELVAQGKKPTDKLSPDDLATLIRRAEKQRKDSIEQFEKGGRPDLAAKEKEELEILATLLPPLMSKDEVLGLATAKAAEMGVTDKSRANQLMGALMKDLKGKADGTVVKEAVDSLFA